MKPYHTPPPPENNEKSQQPLIRRVLPGALVPKPSEARVADAFRRVACACCEDPIVTLGEAIRVEGGLEILHVCATCTANGALGALKAHAEVAERYERARMRRAE